MSDDAPSPEPCTTSTEPAVLTDLRARLRSTRWPDVPSEAGWSLGVDVADVRELVGYWADGFDWPAQEAALNALPRFRVALDGLRVHLVHARAAGPALPLILLTIAWPFLDTAGRTRSGATPRSSRCWSTRPRTARIRATRSTWSSPTCPVTGIRTGRPERRWTPSTSPGCGHG